MDIKNLQQKFKNTEELIKSKPWFTKGKWIITQHPFPKAMPEGVTLHISKKHWFNEDRQGIHIESYLDLNPKKHKKTYITLHALHYDKFPGTKISRKELTKPLVDEIYDEVTNWDGYNFRVGKYGQQPFTKFLDASSIKFSAELAWEIERLCKLLGPKIDQILKSIIT